MILLFAVDNFLSLMVYCRKAIKEEPNYCSFVQRIDSVAGTVIQNYRVVPPLLLYYEKASNTVNLSLQDQELNPRWNRVKSTLARKCKGAQFF